MHIHYRLRLLLTLVIALAACDNRPKAQEKPIGTMFTKEGTLTITRASGAEIVTIDIEIADDQVQREAGMMGRPVLGEKNGMLFIFEEDQFLSFWMLNTMIPLDMMFIDADGKIVTIHANTVPFSKESYGSSTPGRYVLEVNGGFCAQYGIVEGDKVEWKRGM